MPGRYSRSPTSLWPDELRMNPQLELVEEAVFEQEPRHVTEAVLHDVAAVLVLEAAHLADDIASDHHSVLPLRVGERGRDDHLAHGVDAIRVRVAAAAGPRRREHVVGAAAHQNDVARLEQSRLDRVTFIGGAALQRGPQMRSLDDAVERDVGGVDQLPHESVPSFGRRVRMRVGRLSHSV